MVGNTQFHVRVAGTQRRLLSLLAVAATLLLIPVSGARAVAGKTIPDVKVLFPQAVKIVRATPGFSNAVMLEADGTTSSGLPTTSSTGIDQWRFVFQNGESGSPFLSAFIH